MTAGDGRTRREKLQDDLEATADSLIADAHRLIAVEHEKQSRSPGDPHLAALGREAHAIAQGLVRKTTAEAQVADLLGREREGN